MRYRFDVTILSASGVSPLVIDVELKFRCVLLHYNMRYRFDVTILSASGGSPLVIDVKPKFR